MTTVVPRLRMIAGPNGSGKSTLKDFLEPWMLGTYINPDEIESALRVQGYLDLASFSIETAEDEVAAFFRASVLVQKAGLQGDAALVRVDNDRRLFFEGIEANSYHASVLSDFMRRKLLEQQAPFTFETVMSSPDKVEFFRQASKKGYRTYLYYVSTDDPVINVSRVRQRVSMGGHSVPEQKIIERYHRSLDLLYGAMDIATRAYVFDNSADARRPRAAFIAEVSNGMLSIKTDRIPAWFKKAVWDKLPPAVW